MQTVTLTAGEHAGLLALVGAAEVEPRQVRPRVDESSTHHDLLVALRDHLPDALFGVDDGVLLIHIAHFHRLADLEIATIGLLQSHDEAEERGLARAVWTDDAHNAVGRQVEIQVVEQQLVAEGLTHMARLDDVVAQPRTVGDENLQFFLFFFHILVEEFVIRIQTSLRLGMTRLRGHAHPL